MKYYNQIKQRGGCSDTMFTIFRTFFIILIKMVKVKRITRQKKNIHTYRFFSMITFNLKLNLREKNSYNQPT